MTKIGENPVAGPKRFYTVATLAEEGGSFSLFLDKRRAKTKAGNEIRIKSAALASAILEEWNAQGERIDFMAMPMTRFAMTAIDLGARDAESWREAVLAFLKSDLLCYRAPVPSELLERQNAAWDPILDWCATKLDIRLSKGIGVEFVEQPREAIDAARRFLTILTVERLIGVKSATEIAGSAAIAFALLQGPFDAGALFEASRIDERFQAERWGIDGEAAARERQLKQDFLSAARFLSLV